LPKIKPEVSEIDGVFRIKIDIPFDVKFVCSYLFNLDDKNILIDAGLNFIDWKRKFLNILSGLNIRIEEIDYCFVTHEHLDHSGLLKFLKRKNPDLKIVMHNYANECLKIAVQQDNFPIIEKNAEEIAKTFIKYGMEPDYVKRIIQTFINWPKIVRYREPDIICNKDCEIKINSNEIKVIWTPGHSIGHICVFNPRKSHLFSGDHILSRITPHIGIYNQLSLMNPNRFYPNILKTYLESLDKIKNLNPKIIFPAHQEVIFDPLKRIEAIKKHHQNRFRQIKDTIKDKPRTPYEISQIHFGKDLDDMNKYLAMNEVLAHLIYLENKNDVKRIEKNGKILFSS